MSVTGESRRESRCDKGVSHGPPDPTRPDLYVANLSFIGNHSARARMNEPLTRPRFGGGC